MKKILQLTAAVALSLTAIEAKAQLPDGSIAPDWTLVDINGVSHNLYTDLNAGRTVFIDVSATWCGPCWSYHNTNALEDLWVNHGPTGGTGVSGSTTNDVVVYYIEGDGATTSADLNGTGSNTQGDWVTGVSHWIIDPPASIINPWNTSYAIGYFPTIYMICPDRSVTEVGQLSATALYAAKSACSAATAALDAQMMSSTALNTSLASCDSVTPTFRLGNIGTSTLTSCTITLQVDGIAQKTINWTGSIATYGNALVTGVKVGSLIPGTHTITAIVSNPNGGADPTASNNSTNASFIIYPTVGGAMITQSFESAGIPSSWAISNGGDALTWENATTGYSSTKSMKVMWYSIPSGDVDIITLDPMSFASSTTPGMTFDVAYCQYAAENDRLQVEVSTNCGTTWTSVYNKAGAALKTKAAQTTSFVPSGTTQWRNELVPLTAYAGMSNVLVRFKATSAYGNNLYVDNVNVSSSAGVEESEMLNQVNVYPNPMTNNATVDFTIAETNNVSIVMVNTIGQVVLNENLGKLSAGKQNYSLDATSLNNGFYFLNITVGNNTITKKVSINK